MGRAGPGPRCRGRVVRAAASRRVARGRGESGDLRDLENESVGSIQRDNGRPAPANAVRLYWGDVPRDRPGAGTDRDGEVTLPRPSETSDVGSSYRRIFGAGPRGFALSALIVWAAVAVERRYALLPWQLMPAWRWSMMGFLLILAVLAAVWTFRHLPVESRGRRLVTSGPYRYLRHPLYAIVVVTAPPLLALARGSAFHLLLWPLLYLTWRINLVSEESYLRVLFGRKFEEYRARSGCLLPRLARRGGRRR